MMQNILESAQSNPEMLTTLAQLLGGQTETSVGAEEAAVEDQQSSYLSLGARPKTRQDRNQVVMPNNLIILLTQ